MSEQYQERQIAVKLRINEINEGSYVVKEGWEPNYLSIEGGKKVSRVNLMGVILDKEENNAVTNLILDDGSGKIILRSFEEIKNLKEIKIGEGVLVVGKIRLYNNEKYVSPEIIKKMDKGWLKVRRLELEKKEGEVKEKPAEESKEESVEETKDNEEFSDSANKDVIELIKELDKGEGALIEEVKEKLKTNNAEEIIDKLLKDGEIFQNISGRVKVL